MALDSTWLVLGTFNVFSSQSVLVPTQRRLSHELASFEPRSKSLYQMPLVRSLPGQLVYMLARSLVAVDRTLSFCHIHSFSF